MDLNPTKKMRAIDEYENDESPKKEEYNIRANKGKTRLKKQKGDRISIWLAIIISFIVIGVFTYIGYSVLSLLCQQKAENS